MRAVVRLPNDTVVEAGGRMIGVDGTVEITFAWVDFGIGSYEYWGSTGFDSRMGAEDVEIVALDDVTTYLDDDVGDDIDLDDKAKAEVVEALNKLLDADDEKFMDAIYTAAGETAEDGP